MTPHRDRRSQRVAPRGPPRAASRRTATAPRPIRERRRRRCRARGKPAQLRALDSLGASLPDEQPADADQRRRARIRARPQTAINGVEERGTVRCRADCPGSRSGRCRPDAASRTSPRRHDTPTAAATGRQRRDGSRPPGSSSTSTVGSSRYGTQIQFVIQRRVRDETPAVGPPGNLVQQRIEREHCRRRRAGSRPRSAARGAAPGRLRARTRRRSRDRRTADAVRLRGATRARRSPPQRRGGGRDRSDRVKAGDGKVLIHREPTSQLRCARKNWSPAGCKWSWNSVRRTSVIAIT